MSIFRNAFSLLFFLLSLNVHLVVGNEIEETDSNSIISLGYTISSSSFYSSTNFRNINYDNMYTNAGINGLINGNGEGYSLGLVLDYSFTDRKKSNLSLTTRFQYCQNEHNFSEIIESIPSKPTGGQIIYSKTRLSSKVDFQAVTCELLLKWDIPATKIGLTFGPHISNILSSSHSLVYGLDFDVNSPVQFVRETEPGSLFLKQDGNNPVFGPGGYHPRYVDESRTAISLYQGELEYRNSTHLALLFGLQFEADLFWCSLVPYVQYYLGVTSLVGVDSWNLNAIQLGLDYRVYL